MRMKKNMKSIKNQTLAFLLSMILMVVVSCNHQPPSNDVEFSYERIKTLIDLGELEQAQDELNEQLQYDPQDNQARVLLASIHVARAGLSLKDYFRLYRIFNAPKEDSYVLFRSEVIREAEKSNKDVVKTLKGLDAFYGTVSDLQARFGQIQTLNETQAGHMRLALVELNRLTKDAQGPMFYRGIMKLIYFKYLLQNDGFFAIQKKKVCTTTVRKIRSQLVEFQNYTTGMLTDLAFGYPKQKETVENFNREFKKGIQLFQTALNAGEQGKSLRSLVLTAIPEGKFQCDF